MYIDPRRCLQCGSRVRHTFAEEDIRYFQLSTDGTFFETDFWFCTIDCYKKCVRKYLEPRFDFDNCVKDDPLYIEEVGKKGEEYWEHASFLYDLFHPGHSYKTATEPARRQVTEWWTEAKSVAISTAENEVLAYIVAEVQHQNEVDDEKRSAELLKQHQAIDKEYDKLLAQSQKDEEKHMGEFEKLQRQIERDEEEFKAREELLREKPIPFEYRFDHTHIIGGTGQGKSSLIITQFIRDILDEVAVPRSLCARFKVGKISKVLYHRPLRVYDDDRRSVFFKKLVVIDPTLYPPALNMFAPPKRKYEKHVAQQIENNTISLFQYVFSSKGSALTDKQQTCFAFAVSLMLTIPNATIHTFLDLMNDKPVQKVGGMRPDSPFKPYIDRLGPTAKRFFYDSFYDITEYGGTKDQIATRLYGMLRHSTFDAMFSTTENKIDMFRHLQDGDIVLISSPKAVLGTEGSQLFSRYMVALTLQAAFERLTIKRDTWHPALLVIDEAQDVMDEVKTQELLQQARQFKLGVTVAHQQIRPQLTEALFSTISANTRIKYAAARSYEVAAPMARDMFCEPEFLMQRPVGEFACFVGGMTPHPFIVQVPLDYVINLPKMHPTHFAQLVEHMRKKYGVTEEEVKEEIAPPTVHKPLLEKDLPAKQSKSESVQIPIDKKIAQKTDPSAPAPWGKV